MPEAQKILVGVDLTHGDRLISANLKPETRGAIDRAVELAIQQKSHVTLFAAIDLDPHTLSYLEVEDQDALKNLGNQADQVLEQLAAEARRRGAQSVSVTHTFGKSWVEIIKEVLREGHDLVIIGTRSLSGLERVLLGSTGMKLMRNCPCPVWITKPHTLSTPPRFLVADDLSEVGARLVRLGATLAAPVQAELHVLHALEYPWDSATAGHNPKQDAFRKKRLEHSRQELARHLACPEAQALTPPPQVILREELAENVILSYTKEQQIDLLIMATIARSGLSGFLMGNTAERLMPQLNCSVLAVKPDDFRCPITLDS